MKHTGTVWRDLVMLMLLGILSATILLISWVNPKSQKVSKPPGDLIVRIDWAPRNVDVDLWVKAPNDKPVGYSSKSGRYFDLLRDDMGEPGDPTGLNYELAYSRGEPAGEYVVNVMLYALRQGGLPVPVEVQVMEKDHGSILTKDVNLTRVGEELTVWRFTLDKAGNVINKNELPMKLRPAHD